MDDLDPDTADTFEHFVVLLRRLHVRAGKPSYRRMERWAQRERGSDQVTVLARATISDTLLGKRTPRKEFVAAFVEACAVPGQEVARWVGVWERLHTTRSPGTGPRPEFGANAARRHAELRRRYEELEHRLARAAETEIVLRGAQDRLQERVNALDDALKIQTGLVDRCFTLAVTLDQQGKLTEAVEAYTICVEGRRAVLGDGNLATIDARQARAFAAERAGDLTSAAAELREITAVLGERFGPDHQSTLELRQRLAWVTGRLGDWAAAHDELRAVLTARQAHLGDDHPAVLETRNSLAWVQGRTGRWDAAYAELNEVAAARSRMLGAEHPATLETRHMLAWAEGRRGNLAAARTDFEQLVDLRRAVLGEDHPDTLKSEHALAWVQEKLGDLAGAQATYEELLDTQRRVFGENHPQTVLIRRSMLRLGIDYGSYRTTAVLRYPDGRCRTLLFDGSNRLPSAVYLPADGHPVVGAEALQRGTDDPGRLEPTPRRRIDDGIVLLGGAEITVDELIAATLRQVVAEAAHQAGTTVGSVVLTHPAAWGTSRRGVLVQAAIAAGLYDPVLLPVPMAAVAFHAALPEVPVRPGDLFAVYDLGATAFEVSVVCAEPDGWRIVATDGLSDFGAGDLDALVVHLVGDRIDHGVPDEAGRTAVDTWQRLVNPRTADEHRRSSLLWQAAREAKETLSAQSSVEVEVPGIADAVYLSREEFEATMAPLIRRTIDLTRALVERAGVPHGGLTGLLVTGGGGRIPLVSTLLHRALGTVPQVSDSVEVMIAEGAVRDDVRSEPAFSP